MSDISTLRKDKKNANVRMFKQIEKIKSLGFFFIIVSTKEDMLLLIGEAKFSGR